MKVALLSVLSLAFTLSACSEADKDDDDTGEGSTDDGGAAGGETTAAIVATGELTWTLAFDEVAEEEGYADCSYSRTYEGVQMLDRTYLCPDCEVIVRGTATITEGLDCLGLIADPEEEREETWGWSADGRFFRSSLTDVPLGELSSIDPSASDGAAVSWESDYELGSGTMTLSGGGTVSWAVDDSILLDDPFPPQTTPYACGWPTNDPGDLVLDYHPEIGGTFPNVRLQDQCGEEVNLWDLYGSWLVMDTSQPDCGPCLNMASTAHDFITEMADAGYDVRVISFLGNGLADPFSSPSASVYEDFVASYDHGDPIFVDEGFGYAWFSMLAEDELGDDFGFPTWVVVDPTMTVVHGNVGFGSWDDAAAIIEAGG